MPLDITFTNPYPTASVKELLEEHLLIPRKIRHFLRTKKHLTINDQAVNWQSLVHTGDQIRLVFDQEDYPEKTIAFGQADLVQCLYQDEHLIIVNKPVGMKTHANQPHEMALLNHVSAFVGQTCYVVHRLDKETSGVILFAKNPFILPLLNRQLEDKAISREYWALTSGSFPQKDISYRDPIGRDRHDRRKRRVDHKQGQAAVTHIRRLKTFGEAHLLNCQLETGRTHQIRVHLAHHGHPIIGDPLYYPHSKAKRLMLHAHQLTLKHPLSLAPIAVSATSDSFEEGLRESYGPRKVKKEKH